MRKGTWDRMTEWVGSFKYDHAEKPRRMGLGGWLCFAARAVGVVIFAMSCSAVFLPFLVGMSWIDTIIVMGAGLMLSKPFLDFHHLYLAAEAFVLQLWDKFVRNREWSYYGDLPKKEA